MRFNRVARVVGLLAIVVFLLSGAALADGALGFHGWGLRGGLSVDPDQVFLGAHIDFGEFVENLRFTPNITVGFGDNITVISINPDVELNLGLDDTPDLKAAVGFTFPVD